MHISELVIKHPVAVIMFYLGVLLLGGVSLSKLSVDLLPDLSYPKLTIRTNYPDAVPEEVERIVTEPIEQVISTVPGIRRIQSISREGLSLVVLEFTWGQNMDFASLHVREKLDGLGRRLPQEAGKPAIIRLDPASQPIMALSVIGKNLVSLKELSRDVFKRRLEQIQGVALAEVVGGMEREIQVSVDRTKLETLGISVEEIARAIDWANMDMPGGTILKGRYRYSLRTLGAFQSPEDLESVVIGRKPDQSLVLLRDIASVHQGFKERENITHYNGEESIGLLLQKEAGANTVRVSRRVKEVIEELAKEYPEVPIVIAHDQANFISLAIRNVLQAILLGGVLAFLTLFLFLHELRNPVSIAVAIPISIIATFILLYFTNVSLNLMSLGGLALGVGMLVDCSIVVLENIFRHREEGKVIDAAAVTGTKEVAMAVTASTFTTIAVFLPVLYVKGVAGQLFRDQALTVTFALLASLFVSLTLLPILASRFSRRPSPPVFEEDLKTRQSSLFQKRPLSWIAIPVRWVFRKLGLGLKWIFRRISSFLNRVFSQISKNTRKIADPLFRWFDRRLQFLADHYDRILIRALDHRIKTLGIMLVILLVTILIGIFLPRELMPKVDQGEFTMSLLLPPGTSLRGTEESVSRIEKELLKEEDVLDVFSNIGLVHHQTSSQLEQAGLNRAEIRIRMKPGRTSNAMMRQLRDRFRSTPDTKITYSSGETVLSQILGSTEGDVIIKVAGDNMTVLLEMLDQVRKRCAGVSGLIDLRSDYEEGRPEYRIVIDRETAGRYGLSVIQIARFLQNNLTGNLASQFKDFDRKIDIRVRPKLEDRNSLDKLLDALIPVGNSGIPVREVVRIHATPGPTEIHRENQARVISLFANVSGKSLGQTVQEIEKRLSDIPTSEQYRIVVGGAKEEMAVSYKSLMVAALLAIALVYMIMAAQFESLLHPLIIIFSIPMAAVGTTWLLFVTGQSFNVISLIGVVVLVGIAVNDAIVKIDFINQERKRGQPVREAVIEAGKKRFRPIIMTSVTTILGLLPLAIGLGQGAELQRPLALAIIGGLFTSTILTLVVIPVIYSLASRKEVKIQDAGYKILDERN